MLSRLAGLQRSWGILPCQHTGSACAVQTAPKLTRAHGPCRRLSFLQAWACRCRWCSDAAAGGRAWASCWRACGRCARCSRPRRSKAAVRSSAAQLRCAARAEVACRLLECIPAHVHTGTSTSLYTHASRHVTCSSSRERDDRGAGGAEALAAAPGRVPGSGKSPSLGGARSRPAGFAQCARACKARESAINACNGQFRPASSWLAPPTAPCMKSGSAPASPSLHGLRIEQPCPPPWLPRSPLPLRPACAPPRSAPVLRPPRSVLWPAARPAAPRAPVLLQPGAPLAAAPWLSGAWAPPRGAQLDANCPEQARPLVAPTPAAAAAAACGGRPGPVAVAWPPHSARSHGSRRPLYPVPPVLLQRRRRHGARGPDRAARRQAGQPDAA